MTYALVQDVAASWERYEREAAGAVSPPPEGMILHVAGRTEDGFRVIEVWEDEAAWLRFRDERSAPFQTVEPSPAIPRPTFRAIQVLHLVTHDTNARHSGQREEAL
jgi:hypothetical protein